MEEMELKRLLYVALTRAKNKLLVSGHASHGKGGSSLSMEGWTKDLVTAAGLDLAQLLAQNGKPEIINSPMSFPIRTWVVNEADLPETVDESGLEAGDFERASSDGRPLFPPLIEAVLDVPEPGELQAGKIPADQVDDSVRSRWPVTGEPGRLNSIKVGTMVHKAIELWLFPGDPRLIPLLEITALNEGLADSNVRGRHIHRVLDILERLQVLPIWAEMNTADERHHEIPYNISLNENYESRKIDLLYRLKDDWYVVDFKTDRITKPEQKRVKVLEHTKQILDYRLAIKHLLNIDAVPRLCYLDDHGSVSVMEVPVP